MVFNVQFNNHRILQLDTVRTTDFSVRVPRKKEDQYNNNNNNFIDPYT